MRMDEHIGRRGVRLRVDATPGRGEGEAGAV